MPYDWTGSGAAGASGFEASSGFRPSMSKGIL